MFPRNRPADAKDPRDLPGCYCEEDDSNEIPRRKKDRKARSRHVSPKEEESRDNRKIVRKKVSPSQSPHRRTEKDPKKRQPTIAERGDAKPKRRKTKKVKAGTSTESVERQVRKSPHRERRTPKDSPRKKSPAHEPFEVEFIPPPPLADKRCDYYCPGGIANDNIVPFYVTSPPNAAARMPIIIPVCSRKHQTKTTPTNRHRMDEAGTQYPSASPTCGVPFSNQTPEPLTAKHQSGQTAGKPIAQHTQAPSAHDAYIETTLSAVELEVPPKKEILEDTTTNIETTEFANQVDSNLKGTKFALDACQLIRRLATLEEKEKRRLEIESRASSLPEVNNTNPFIHLPCPPCVDAAKKYLNNETEYPKYVSPLLNEPPEQKEHAKLYKPSHSKNPNFGDEKRKSPQTNKDDSAYQIIYQPTECPAMKSITKEPPEQKEHEHAKLYKPSYSKHPTFADETRRSQPTNKDDSGYQIIFKPIECPAMTPVVRVPSPTKIVVEEKMQQSSVPVVQSGYQTDEQYDTMSSDKNKSSQPSQLIPPRICMAGDSQYPCPAMIDINRDVIQQRRVPKESAAVKPRKQQKTCCLKRRCSREGSSGGMRADNFLGLAEVTDGGKIWRMLLAEFLGTLLLVYIGCGSILVFEKTPTTMEIALTFGLVIGSIVQCICHISGGHINPAVTISFFVICEMKLLRALLYIVSQLLGAAAGAALLKLATPDVLESDLGVTGISHVNEAQAFLAEVMLTFLLVFVIHAVVDPRRKDVKGSAPLAIGLAAVACHLSGIKFSGSSMNPARSFGPALVANYWTHHWVYWAGPIVGAIFAALVYRFCFRVRKEEDESYNF